MAQWILKANGKVIPRRSHRPLVPEEVTSEVEEKEKHHIFETLTQAMQGDGIEPPKGYDDEVDFYQEYEDEEEAARQLPNFDNPVDNSGRAIDQQPAYDKLINIELMLPHHGDAFETAKVKRRTIHPDGRTHGTYHDLPEMNTLVYDMEFSDGTVKEYAANVIAHEMYEQTDNKGFTSNEPMTPYLGLMPTFRPRGEPSASVRPPVDGLSKSGGRTMLKNGSLLSR
jgi:hypothetical protein